MYKCKTHEVEDIFFDDETWFKVVTKDWIKIWIDLSDIALVWRLEWSLKQRVLWEIMEKLSWRDKRKLIAVHLNDAVWAVENYILYKRIDNCY